MKIISTLLLVASLVFVSYAFSSPPRDIDKISLDQAYNKTIIGQWSQGESPYGISSFEEGGLYQGWIYENSKKERLLYFMKGKWWIEKGKLYNTLNEISPPLPGLSMEVPSIDKIVEITEDTMTFIDEGFTQHTKHKIKLLK